MKYRGNGYIQKKVSSSKALYEFINSIVYSKLDVPVDIWHGDHVFVAHIFVSMKSKQKKTNVYCPSTPIYSRLIENEFTRDFDVHALERNPIKPNGIIEIIPHNQLLGKCREFRLIEKLYATAVELENKDTKLRWRVMYIPTPYSRKNPLVNLMTGDYWRSRVKSQFKYKSKSGVGDDFNTPDIIKKSIKAIQPFPFNPKLAGSFVNALEQKTKHAETVKLKAEALYNEDPRYERAFEIAKTDYLRARARLNNCRRAQQAIIGQKPELIGHSKAGDPIYEYKAAYKIQKGGRTSEIGGGYQSANRVFKHLCMEGVTDLVEIYNYDLKAAQAYILQQELQHCNIECPWLDDYLSGKTDRQELADNANLNISTWKTVFYAIIMGGIIKNDEGKIYLAIKNLHYKKENPDKWANAHLDQLKKCFEPLIEATKQWRKHIYLSHDDRYTYMHGGLKHWKNACGMKLKEFGLKESPGKALILVDRTIDKQYSHENPRHVQAIAERKRSLAAFILQGQEAAFIHHLTVLCSKHDIPVYRNEHDGLMVGQKIPQKLIKDAGKLSGFKEPQFEIKEICPESKLEYYRQYLKHCRFSGPWLLALPR